GCLSRGNASRICFDGPLDYSRQVEPFVKAAQQQFQLPNVERGGRAAAEVNRRWTKQGAAISSLPTRFVQFEFAQERLTKSRGLRAIQQILVKRAIRTNVRAEGDVNVDVANMPSCDGSRVACVGA